MHIVYKSAMQVKYFSSFKRASAKFFYRLFRQLSHVDVPLDGVIFVCSTAK
jgi:hypothetical protein